jgi:hypothetical protein
MIPASIRNNNPGALYMGPSARKFGATSKEILVSRDGKHQIATFPTAVHGAAALFDNLMNAKGVTGYYYRGRTLDKAIATWCGSIRAHTYLRLIEQKTGLKPDVVLSVDFLRDADRTIQLAQAMAFHEAGQDYPLKANEWLHAHVMAFSGGEIAPEPLPTNDVPTMRPEMRRQPLLARIKAAIAAIGSVGIIDALGGFEASFVPPPPPGIKQTVQNLGQWGEAVPWHQWQVLLVGAGVFGVVVGVSGLMGQRK